jgi:hypothetical protein
MLIELSRLISNARDLKLHAHAVHIVDMAIADYRRGGNQLISGLLREYQLTEDDSPEQDRVVWEIGNAVYDWIYMDCDYRNAIRYAHGNGNDEKDGISWYTNHITRTILAVLKGQKDLEAMKAEIRVEFQRLLDPDYNMVGCTVG